MASETPAAIPISQCVRLRRTSPPAMTSPTSHRGAVCGLPPAAMTRRSKRRRERIDDLGFFAKIVKGELSEAPITKLLGWKFLGVLLTGGSERAVRGLVVSLVIIGVCVAALANLSQTAGIVVAVGQAVWVALGEAVRGSV